MKVDLEISGIDGYETTCTVYYSVYKEYIGRTDGRYGPKLEPDEPAYIEIEEIKGSNGEEVILTDKMKKCLLELVTEYETERYYDEYD